MSDPIVEEVRQIRMAHARRFNFDLDAICEDLRDVQRHCGHKVVRLAAKKLQQVRAQKATA
jgi:hypothetical protein